MAAGGPAAPHPPPIATRAAPPSYDWGEAPAAGVFHGRAAELATLARWLGDDRCRLVGVVGLGGIGKTALTAWAARELAPRFDAVHWRSLRNALPCAEWLAGAVLSLSEQRAVPAEGEEARLRQLLGLLRERRCLLVLDNLETVLEPGAPEARFRDGYGVYGQALWEVGEAGHPSCLLVTSREQPPELWLRDGVGLLRLGGLDAAAGRALLANKGLVGDAAAWGALVGRYGGNALALQVVGETIGAVFGGEIAAFLSEGEAVSPRKMASKLGASFESRSWTRKRAATRERHGQMTRNMPRPALSGAASAPHSIAVGGIEPSRGELANQRAARPRSCAQ